MVWGEPHIVTVYRKSETVYEAIGNYMCETICVNDQSEGAAIKRWREAAAGSRRVNSSCALRDDPTLLDRLQREPFLIGTRSAQSIRASGHTCRINRPDT